MNLPQLSVATGRFVTGLFFVLAGVNKLTSYSSTISQMEGAGLSGGLLPLVIALEFGGGLILLLGKGRQIFIATCIALALFSLATNAVFHKFWELEDPMRTLELSLFFKNLVIAGALITFAGLKAQSLTDQSPAA